MSCCQHLLTQCAAPFCNRSGLGASRHNDTTATAASLLLRIDLRKEPPELQARNPIEIVRIKPLARSIVVKAVSIVPWHSEVVDQSDWSDITLEEDFQLFPER